MFVSLGREARAAGDSVLTCYFAYCSNGKCQQCEEDQQRTEFPLHLSSYYESRRAMRSRRVLSAGRVKTTRWALVRDSHILSRRRQSAMESRRQGAHDTSLWDLESPLASGR